MTDRPVVLGAGIAGLSIAWELTRAGAPPVVLGGARPRTSEVAAGMLAPTPEMALDPALGKLAVEGLRHYPGFLEELAEASAIDPGFRRSGILRVAYNEAEVESLREGVGAYEAAGMPSRWLSAKSIVAAIPGIGAEGLGGGLLSFDEAQVLPGGLLAALEDSLRARGAEIRPGEVVAVANDGSGVRVDLAGGDCLRADAVVVALGSWTARLPGLTGTVHPVKGQLLVFNEARGPEQVLYWGQNYVLTKSDGTIIVGGTVEPDAGFADAPDAVVEGLRGLLPTLWPALVGAPALARAGLRPRSDDGLPLIGPVPGMPGAYLFTGHFRNGFLLAPVSARLAAAELMGGPSSPELRRLRPSRLVG